MSSRAIWLIWFVGSILWFAISVTYVSGERDLGYNPLGQSEPTRLSPQLARADCSPMVDPLSHRACQGATALARERRVASNLMDSERQAMAGTIVVAPPLAALIVVVLLARRAERRERLVRS